MYNNAYSVTYFTGTVLKYLMEFIHDMICKKELKKETHARTFA